LPVPTPFACTKFHAYPLETVIAEKLEALTTLGLLNSLMKDFYDLALVSRMYPFEGQRNVSQKRLGNIPPLRHHYQNRTDWAYAGMLR
jgi:predicted nucleotidyltransferase component of viral defense system